MKFWRRKQFEDDMDAELRLHIESYAEDLVRSGLSREEAMRRARIEFGSMEKSKEECRQSWGLQRLDELRADLRLTFRTMRTNPGFAVIGILSLALGIGANTAIFGVVDAVMLRLLPVRDPAHLVFVYSAGTSGRDGPPYPFFELVRDQAKSFEAVAAYSPSNMEMTTERGREQVRGLWVSGNFYETLGVRPLIGRSLSPSDDKTPGVGGPDGAVAVISRAFWQQRFGGDPTVVGRTIQLSKHSATIVGVMPTEIMSLEPGRPVDIAFPMMLSDPAKMRDRVSTWLFVVARLKGDIPVATAQAETNTLFRAFMADLQVPGDVRNRLFQRIDLAPAGQGHSGLRSQFSKPLTSLMILAGLVLVAACVNMANLMLARATAQQRNFAVRLAIGAGSGRLVRQTLTEALVLVGIGSTFGIALAHVGQVALAAYFAEGNDQIVLDLSLNLRVLLFTLLVSVLSGLALGIAPAMRVSHLDPAMGLRADSRSVAGSRVSLWLGRGLVVVQVALSIILLAGAGLFIRSLRALETVDLGFRREGILMMEVAPEREMFGTVAWLTLQSEILDKVRRIPGVTSVSWATFNPMSGRDRGASIAASGFTPRTESDKEIHLSAVSPDYFGTIGLPVLVGRTFTNSETTSSPKVAIINEAAAHFYFGDRGPIGQTVKFTNYPQTDLIYQVVGVVKDSKHDSLREASARFVYLPITQSVDRINRLALAARVSGDPSGLAAQLRQEIQCARPSLLITNVSTLEKQIEQLLLRERLVASLSATFGAVALVLASIGLYGTLAFAVTRRTNEIGIRLALGAARHAVVWLILREALVLTLAGIVIALPVVLVLGQLSKALLYGVTPVDPLAFTSAALLLLTFTALAAVVPSRRASLLDPISALKRE